MGNNQFVIDTLVKKREQLLKMKKTDCITIPTEWFGIAEKMEQERKLLVWN